MSTADAVATSYPNKKPPMEADFFFSHNKG